VTNESESEVKRHAQKYGMEFPIAMTKGEALERAFGIRGFPSAYLIDARGRVAWADHPASLEDADIEKLLAGQTFVAPLADERHAKINAALEKRAFGQAHGLIEKALAQNPGDAALQRALDSIEASAKALEEDARKASDAGHFGYADALYAEVVELFDGLPAAATAEAARKAIHENADAKHELEAYELLVEGRAALAAGDENKARSKLGLAAKHADTPSGREAKDLLARSGR
jgi:hypothetical protein